MSLIDFLIFMGLLCVCWWFFNKVWPAGESPMLKIINVTLIICAVVLALTAFGIMAKLKSIMIPSL